MSTATQPPVALDPHAETAPSGQPWLFGVRTCGKGGKAHGGFVWPAEAGAVVTCPDWSSAPACGNGLHFNPWGMGDWSLLGADDPDALWLIVKADPALAVAIDGGEDGGKSKAPWVVIDTVGDGLASLPKIMARLAALRATRLKAIKESTVTSGYRAHAATSGDSAHAATSGYRAHAATSGYIGIASALGVEGIARAGANGAIVLAEYRYDRDRNRYDIVAMFASKVGENGIEPDTFYTLRDGKPVAVTP